MYTAPLLGLLQSLFVLFFCLTLLSFCVSLFSISSINPILSSLHLSLSDMKENKYDSSWCQEESSFLLLSLSEMLRNWMASSSLLGVRGEYFYHLYLSNENAWSPRSFQMANMLLAIYRIVLHQSETGTGHFRNRRSSKTSTQKLPCWRIQFQ